MLQNIKSVITIFFIILLTTSNAQERPNVLFIAVDDLNDWVGALGHEQSLTPNIDALAGVSTLFTQAHCQAPICGPSRASLLTGLYPHNSGNYLQLKDVDIKKSNKRTAESIFLPDYFEEFGYSTYGVGKIFHTGDGAHSFDLFGGVFDGAGPKPETRFNYDPSWFPEKVGSTQTDWGAYPEKDEEMPDYKSATWAEAILQARHENPFFLAVGFVRPHVPWYVPAKWFEKFPVDSLKMPPYLANDMDDIPEMGKKVADAPQMPTTEWLKETGQWKYAVQGYLASINFVDHQIGRVIEALKKSDHWENTIVVLWSDHGYHLGEKNRMAKQSLWQRDTRSLLVIKEPGQSKGQVSNNAVQLIDIYPTLLDLAHLSKNEMNDGRSLVPLLKDPNRKWEYPALTSYGKDNMAVTYEDYRLIRYEDGSMELYDLENDPNEWNNLARKSKYKQKLKELSSFIPKNQEPLSKYSTYNFNAYFTEKSE